MTMTMTAATWVRDILIDLAIDTRPEWCEVCADLDPDKVPARATTTVDGVIVVCADCAEAHAEMTGPTLVEDYVTITELGARGAVVS